MATSHVSQSRSFANWPTPLAIWHLLATETDDRHTLTTGDIATQLTRYGVSLNSKAVAHHLKKLEEAGLAESAHSTPRCDPATSSPLCAKDGTPITVKKGWRRKSSGPEGWGFSALTDDELLYLGHRLFESCELTSSERSAIWEKLKPLMGPRGHAFGTGGSSREAPNSWYMNTLSVLQEAMSWTGTHGERGAKVRFSLIRWDRQGAGDSFDYEELEVDPLCVTHRAEGSYLVGWQQNHDYPSHFRIDLIRGASIAEDETAAADNPLSLHPIPADLPPFSSEEADSYVDEHPYLCEGKAVDVLFRLRDVNDNHYQVRRMFRSAFKGLHYDSSGFSMLYGRVHVCEEGAFRWAVQMWPAVEILKPLSIRQRLADYAQNLTRAYLTPADLEGIAHTEKTDSPLMQFVSRLALDRSYNWEVVVPLYDMGSHHPQDLVRIDNLRMYLEAMNRLHPKLLLVGMAPGRKGGAKTGVPFTDEAHLYAEPTSNFGRALGAGSFYRSAHPAQVIGSERETSASTVWEGLAQWEKPPLLWNVCPFQCHEPEDTFTNRTPTAQELALGLKYLKRLQALFSISSDHVWCLGKEAQQAVFPDRPGYHLLHLPSSEGGVSECLAELETLRASYDV